MAKADTGVLPYYRESEIDKLCKFWSGVDYTKYINEINRRIQLLRTLYEIYPNLELQAEALEGWRTKLFNFDEYNHSAELKAPAVHYRVLPNELVFEIDADNLKYARNEAKKITRRLIYLGAKPFVGYSGNRGYHIHLLVAPPDGDVFGFANSLGAKEFTVKLFEVLMGIMESYNIDTGVMEYVHTIRSFYSLNLKTMRFKKPVFGDRYSVWVLPRNLWDRTINQLREDIETQEIIKELSAFDEPKIRVRSLTRKYKWIEKVLNHPEKIEDGRERLLWLAIVPYLILQGYSDSRIEEMCQKWIERTGVEWKSKYRCKVRSMIKHCRDYERETGKKWMPISLEKLIETFGDLEYLKRFKEW